MTEYKKTNWSEFVGNCENGYINEKDSDFDCNGRVRVVWCELLNNRCNKFVCPLHPEYKKEQSI